MIWLVLFIIATAVGLGFGGWLILRGHILMMYLFSKIGIPKTKILIALVSLLWVFGYSLLATQVK